MWLKLLGRHGCAVVGCVLPCAAYGCCLCIPLWDWLDDHLPTSFLPFSSFSLSLDLYRLHRTPPIHSITPSLAVCAHFAFPIIALPSFEELLLCLLTWGLLEPWKKLELAFSFACPSIHPLTTIHVFSLPHRLPPSLYTHTLTHTHYAREGREREVLCLSEGKMTVGPVIHHMCCICRF